MTESAARVTVNLSARGADALGQLTGLTGDSKTEAINKALQAYLLIQNAQEKGGGVLLQEDKNSTPTKILFY